MKHCDLGPKTQDLMRLILGYVTVCLATYELDVKYYVNLWENELENMYYGGEYHRGSLDLEVK